jgi:hypothetical protein
MEEHEHEDSIDSDLSLDESSEENRKTVAVKFNANNFKKGETPLFKEDNFDDETNKIAVDCTDQAKEVLMESNQHKKTPEKRNTFRIRSSTSEFKAEDSSITMMSSMKNYFNRSASFRVKSKMTNNLNKEEFSHLIN